VAAQPAGTASQDVGGGLALLVIEAQTAHVIAEDVRDTKRPFVARHVRIWAVSLSGSGGRVGF
jgi:hypothetical protein